MMAGLLITGRLHIVQRARLVMVAGVCDMRICNLTHQGAAHGGPVVLRTVRATLFVLDCACLFVVAIICCALFGSVLSCR